MFANAQTLSNAAPTMLGSERVAAVVEGGAAGAKACGTSIDRLPAHSYHESRCTMLYSSASGNGSPSQVRGGSFAARSPGEQEVMADLSIEALRATAQSEPWFFQLADSMSDVFWIYEPRSARFLHVSSAYEREWMRSADALYADPRQWFGPAHDDDRQSLRAALASGDGYAIEYRATLPSGEERWIAERACPVASESGHPSRIAGVSQDITARKGVELALRRSDRRRGNLLAMVAHELRNPLGPIRSAAAVLARLHADGPANERKAVAIIERQVHHLTRLVDDLLDVARIDHGKLRLDSERVRLNEVVVAAVDANRALAEKSRLHLELRLPRNEVWVLGDPVRLTQVFSNLLHNATKFSVAGGLIEISVRAGESDRQVAVHVRDEGIGIAADVVDSIFDLFTQDEQPAARDCGGLGIGLSVVRSLTELHGGKVLVHSDGIGKGSEFVVTLPTSDAPPLSLVSARPEVHRRAHGEAALGMASG